VTNELPDTGTTRGVAAVTLLTATFSKVMKDDVKSCPFKDTSTEVLPATPATDRQDTVPDDDALPETNTAAPNLHHDAAPSSAPEMVTDRGLPPQIDETDGVTERTVFATA
jgi:hypothetical protein